MMIDSISSWSGTLLLLVGCISLIWGGALLIMKLVAGPSREMYAASWGKICTLLIVGGGMIVGGTNISGLLALSSEEGEGDEPTPTPSPSTSENPTPAPTSEPASPPAEPADLTWLWITLGITVAVAILVVGVLLTVMLTKKLRRASRDEAERERLEEARRKRLEETWTRWTDRHQAVKEKVLAAETDWDMIFSYPCLSDATIPQTRDLHRALRAVDHASSTMPSGLDETTDIGSLPYPTMVLAAEESWEAALSFAKHTGQKLLPKEERKTIEQIIKLLRLAQDSGGSTSERDVAYARAQKLIAGLRVFKVPEKALAVIETEQRLMLEAPSAERTYKVGGSVDDTKKSPIIL